jgi:hypothetical protein
MAKFSQVVITQNGQALMAKIIAGLIGTQFTKMSTTSDTFTGLEDLTTLTNIKQTSTITKIAVKSTTEVDIEALFNNAELTIGYSCNTIGLYATDPDAGEILYAVMTTVDGNGDYIPSTTEQSNFSMSVNLTLAVGNSSNISLNVDPAGTATVFDVNVVQNELEAYISAVETGYYEGVKWADYDIFPDLDLSDRSLWERIFSVEFDSTASTGWNLEIIDEATATSQTISANLLPGKYNIKNKRTPANYLDYYGLVDLLFSATIDSLNVIIPVTVSFRPAFYTQTDYPRYITLSSLFSTDTGSVVMPCSFAVINEQVSPIMITRYSVQIANSTQTGKQFLLTDDGGNITFYVPKKVATTTNTMFSVLNITGLAGSAIPIEIPVKTDDGSDFNITGYTAVLEVYSPENTAVSLLTKNCTVKNDFTFKTEITAEDTQTIIGENKYKVTISNTTTTQSPLYGKITIMEE